MPLGLLAMKMPGKRDVHKRRERCSFPNSFFPGRGESLIGRATTGGRPYNVLVRDNPFLPTVLPVVIARSEVPEATKQSPCLFVGAQRVAPCHFLT